VHFPFPTVFVSIDQIHLCWMRRCGNEVLMHRASRMSIEATTIEFALSLFFFYLQIWWWTEIKQEKRKKKRCELSVFLLCLFIHIHYLFSMRMHLFKSIYAHTYKVTNMIIIRAHSMCQNYHIYFIWSSPYILWSCSIYLFLFIHWFKAGIINHKSFNLYFINELFD
jgi:hypothetical protein